MNQTTNPMPGTTFVVASLAIGVVLSPILIPVASGFGIAHLIARRRRAT